MSPSLPKLNVDWRPFEVGQLERHLGLTSPPFAVLTRRLASCGTWKIASPSQSKVSYIDRDYIEDHNIDSKSLCSYPNSCRRVHFFSVDGQIVRTDNGLKKNAIVLGLPFSFTFVSLNQAYNCRFFPVYFRCPRIDGVYQPGIFQPVPTYWHRKRTGKLWACKDFSDQAYLGFSVIKPLHNAENPKWQGGKSGKEREAIPRFPNGRNPLFHRSPFGLVSALFFSSRPSTCIAPKPIPHYLPTAKKRHNPSFLQGVAKWRISGSN